MVSDGKIKSKDLSYETNLPPFLQRLHAQKAGNVGGDPDRHERQIARPKKPQAADEDDGPTIVDESGETVTKEELDKRATKDGLQDPPELQDLVRGPSLDNGELKVSGALPDDERKGEQKITDGTATKKRKAVKAVGGDTGDRADGDDNDSKPNKPLKKVKKKAKAIKLAFDDGDT